MAKVAVDRVSLGIGKGECLGLLGTYVCVMASVRVWITCVGGTRVCVFVCACEA